MSAIVDITPPPDRPEHRSSPWSPRPTSASRHPANIERIAGNLYRIETEPVPATTRWEQAILLVACILAPRLRGLLAWREAYGRDVQLIEQRALAGRHCRACGGYELVEDAEGAERPCSLCRPIGYMGWLRRGRHAREETAG